MAKVWFAGEQWQRRVSELPLGDAVRSLELINSDWVCGEVETPSLPAGSDFGRNQRVFVEVDPEEAQSMTGWKAGFYLTRLSTDEASKRLHAVGKELDPFNEN